MVLSLAYLICAIYILLSFSGFCPPPSWCTFFKTKQNKTSLSGYSATSASSSDCHSEKHDVRRKYRSWVLSSSAHALRMLQTLMSLHGGRDKGCMWSRKLLTKISKYLRSSHRRHSRAAFKGTLLPLNMTWLFQGQIWQLWQKLEISFLNCKG